MIVTFTDLFYPVLEGLSFPTGKTLKFDWTLFQYRVHSEEVGGSFPEENF